jgi:hypothetical protein
MQVQQLFVQNCYSRFRDNPTNGLVADIRLQTDERIDFVFKQGVSFHVVKNA